MADVIFDPEEKARLARAWKSSGLTQAEYCQKHGIASTRTLRGWLKKWPSAGVGAERAVRATIESALAALASVLRSLDAEEACPAARPAANNTGEVPGVAPGQQSLTNPSNVPSAGVNHPVPHPKESFWTF